MAIPIVWIANVGYRYAPPNLRVARWKKWGSNMEEYRVLFDDSEWQDGIRGARFKSFRKDSKQLRLLELSSEFVEPDWCEKGHVGFVVQGEFEIDFRGELVRYPQGSGIFIPAGSAGGHKARSITPTVLLFLVEDIQSCHSGAGRNPVD